MKQLLILVVVFVLTVPALADTFGTGDNAFDIDFVPISGSTNPSGGLPAGYGFTFTGVATDYRMGTYEVTNAQWNKFKAAYGTVTGNPSDAYNDDTPYWPSDNVPTTDVSWYEAAQFVNYLNTSTGHTAAYKFTGTIHTSNYTLDVWGTGDADGTNLYRNKNAYYFLPTEDEWVKAAYWNGTSLQTYATKAGESLYRGNGSNGGWNFDNPIINRPWNVGSGSQELNGTYDMMGNVVEWMESPYKSGYYLSNPYRGIRGGWFIDTKPYLASFSRHSDYPAGEGYGIGFRVASIPEPATLLLLSVGLLKMRTKLNKRKIYGL